MKPKRLGHFCHGFCARGANNRLVYPAKRDRSHGEDSCPPSGFERTICNKQAGAELFELVAVAKEAGRWLWLQGKSPRSESSSRAALNKSAWQKQRSIFRAVWVVLGLAITGVAIPAASAPAEGNTHLYGCPDQINYQNEVIIQGANGFFFRQRPDLESYFPLSAHTAKKLGDLSRVLKNRGIELVLLPIPPRGLALARHLDNLPLSLTQGFNATSAKSNYNHFIATLEAAGVNVIDMLATLESKRAGVDYFLPLDHHWSEKGAEAAAVAVAKNLKARNILGATGAGYQTTDTGNQILVSRTRRAVQLACEDALPANLVMTSETHQIASAQTTQGQALDIFDEETPQATVALTGTSFSDLDYFNFAGRLTQYIGLEVTNFAVSGGNQFVSISGYLTSPAFAEAPPKVILWENPVYNNFGEFGDQPLDELIASASGQCEAPSGKTIPLEQDAGELRATAQLPEPGAGESYVKFDSGIPTLRAATFTFHSAAGNTQSISVARSDRYKANGRFYVKSPFADVASITVSASGADPAHATLTTCQINVK